MQVNINHNNTIDGFAERIISVDIEEYSEIVLCLKSRLEILEEKLEEYKVSDNKRLRSYIPRKEAEIEQLKNLIEIMQ